MTRINGFMMLGQGRAERGRSSSESSVASPSVTTLNSLSHIVPWVSATARTRWFSTYSVTSSSVVADLPRTSRVSRNLVPTPDLCSDRYSVRTTCGKARQNTSALETASNTSANGALTRRESRMGSTEPSCPKPLVLCVPSAHRCPRQRRKPTKFLAAVRIRGHCHHRLGDVWR